MSDIVLTAAVRQNLLSLQGTADLLSTTQTRLATGKKVNSALDNPTNYFTAAGLDARAGDISNLLDSIGNGVQVLQAANTGITSLQKLVDTAKSIANQALQQPTGYSTKSSIKFIGTGTGVAPSRSGDGRRPHDQQAQRWCFHVHQFRGHRRDNHGRHGCRGVRPHSQDGDRQNARPAQYGAGSGGRQPVGFDHQHG